MLFQLVAKTLKLVLPPNRLAGKIDPNKPIFNPLQQSVINELCPQDQEEVVLNERILANSIQHIINTQLSNRSYEQKKDIYQICYFLLNTTLNAELRGSGIKLQRQQDGSYSVEECILECRVIGTFLISTALLIGTLYPLLKGDFTAAGLFFTLTFLTLLLFALNSSNSLAALLHLKHLEEELVDAEEPSLRSNNASYRLN